MSHFTSVKTQFVSAAHLVRALTEMGLVDVEYHEKAQPIRNRWDNRTMYGEIIVRKAKNSWLLSDFGYKKDQDNKFQLVIDNIDERKLKGKWSNQLTQRYSYFTAQDVMQEQGFSVADVTTQEDESIRLVMRRMA